MEHKAGAGRFTVGARGTRVKRGPGNEFPELAAPTTMVDVWLAENPANADEAAQAGLGVSKTAANLAGPITKGFEREAAAIAAGIAKYGSLEEYEKHQFEENDFFADAPEVSFKDQFTRDNPNPTPKGNNFESHVGSEGVRRTKLNIRKEAEFEVTPDSIAKMAARFPDAKGGHAPEPKKSDPSAHINVVTPPSRIQTKAVQANAAPEKKKRKHEKPSKRVRLSEDFSF
jgi:hypothetical protein